MAVNLPELQDLLPVPGIRLGTVNAGIKQTARDDLAILILEQGSRVAGVFTQSHFRAAPIKLAEAGLLQGNIRALVINSGNANAATGSPGLDDAKEICASVAARVGGTVLPFSTGVIGERLPLDRILPKLSICIADASEDHWRAAALAIMTTDTAPKALSRQCDLDGTLVTITGMAKGAGMIKPNMATMLAYIACDAQIAQPILNDLAKRVADASFNRITVDGDTSTNDAFMLISTGKADMQCIEKLDDPRLVILEKSLGVVAKELAQRIIRDGEGATKFVTVKVSGGFNSQECLEVAYTVAESPLVKTALFAGDPNWGRFCMAIGRSDIKDLDPDSVALFLNDVCVAQSGLMHPDYTEAAGAQVMSEDEFCIRIELGRGTATETIWTSDLSYEYVRINAEYRS